MPQSSDSYLLLPRRRLFSGLEWHALAIGTLAALVLLVGYGFNVAPVQTILPDFPTMKPRTAGMLVAVSIAYILSLRPSRGAQLTSTLLAAAVMAFAAWIALTRPELAPENPWAIIPSNATVFGLFAGALAIVAINHQKRPATAIAVLALVAAIPALFRILALLLFQGAPDANSPLNTMALHTAILLVWFLLVCILLHPKLGVARVLLRASLRGRLLRGALVIVVILPIAAAAFSLFLVDAIDGAEETLFAFNATMIVTMGTILVWWLSSVAERWQAEANAHAARLSRANEALEQYASSAAHDLKAPARHVLLYGELLETALATGDMASARRHAGLIRQSALELPGLVDGMLEHARVAGTPISLTDTSLSELVQAAAAQHAASLMTAGAVIRVVRDARLRCDSALMTTVFQVLIANAMKSRRRDGRLEITIDCARDADGWRVAVEDNGAGFDPEVASAAFNPLARGVRTAGASDGMGLATCRNIVQSHGGEIGIDPAHRTGARVVFTLPASPKASIAKGMS